MKYGYTSEGTPYGRARVIPNLIRRLLFFIPDANPDAKRFFPQVTRWALEIGDHGCVEREIGLASDGAPLFLWPDSRNYGYWPDAGVFFRDEDIDPMSSSEFEALVQKLTIQNKFGIKQNEK